MAKNFQNGDTVRLGKTAGVAQRYRGRKGTFVGRTGSKATGKFLVSMGTRRAAPLAVFKRDIS